MPQMCFRPHKACLLSRDSEKVRFSLKYLAKSGLSYDDCKQYLSNNCHNTPDQNNTREAGFVSSYSWRTRSIMVERVWQQEKEATGHVPSEVKEQGVVVAGAQLAFS